LHGASRRGHFDLVDELLINSLAGFEIELKSHSNVI
jgi:hypothetical protein